MVAKPTKAAPKVLSKIQWKKVFRCSFVFLAFGVSFRFMSTLDAVVWLFELTPNYRFQLEESK